GLLVVAVVFPVFSNAGVCSADTTLFCSLAVAVLAWVVGSWLLMVWLTRALRLSWRFMVATVALQLLVIEVMFQSDNLWWLLGLLVVPLVAAVVTDPGSAREEPPRWRSLTILVVGVVVFVEFLLWGWFVVLGGG
ncbi:MAG: hypothetical protein HY829_07575, partial [Actinobacteria bacterium]|nr:hypothetical protein [Actinomycetota bacterium]